MATYSYRLTKPIKNYFKYDAPGLPPIYLPTALVAADAPTSFTLTADGLVEPKAAKVQDPAEVQAQATKAKEAADRATARAAKLAAEVERLKAATVAPQPAARTKKAKAVAA